MEENKIIIYQTEDGQTQIDVRLENDTVWLTQAQMVQLFKSSRTNILEHIQHIYEVEELDKISTCRNFRQVQKEGNRMVNRTKTMYNLDMIISVGYRVNTKRGIKFRQWANKVLKQYLIKGYAVNERIRKEQIGELRQLVGMLGRTIQDQPLLSTDETNALFEVVTNYILTRRPRKSLSMLPMRMRWRLSMVCAKSLEVQHSLEMKRTTLSRAASDRYTRPLEAKNSIPVWRKKLPCCSTLSPRIILSVMATNALLQPSSFGSSTIIISSIAKMAPNAWLTTPL